MDDKLETLNFEETIQKKLKSNLNESNCIIIYNVHCCIDSLAL